MGRSNLGKAISLEVAFQQDLQNNIIGIHTPRWDYLFLLVYWWDVELFQGKYWRF